MEDNELRCPVCDEPTTVKDFWDNIPFPCTNCGAMVYVEFDDIIVSDDDEMLCFQIYQHKPMSVTFQEKVRRMRQRGEL